MKNIHVRDIDDSIYFRALEAKAHLRCESWSDLFEKIFTDNFFLAYLEEKKFQEEKRGSWAKWAASIDERLDREDREIAKNGEDALV